MGEQDKDGVDRDYFYYNSLCTKEWHFTNVGFLRIPEKTGSSLQDNQKPNCHFCTIDKNAEDDAKKLRPNALTGFTRQV